MLPSCCSLDKATPTQHSLQLSSCSPNSSQVYACSCSLCQFQHNTGMYKSNIDFRIMADSVGHTVQKKCSRAWLRHLQGRALPNPLRTLSSMLLCGTMVGGGDTRQKSSLPKSHQGSWQCPVAKQSDWLAPQQGLLHPQTAAARIWRRTAPVRSELDEICQSTPRVHGCQRQRASCSGTVNTIPAAGGQAAQPGSHRSQQLCASASSTHAQGRGLPRAQWQ